MNSPLKYKEIVEGGAGNLPEKTFCVGTVDGIKSSEKSELLILDGVTNSK